MADIYGQLPNFATGQVLSARAHLNPLQDYATSLQNDFLGVTMPFTGMRFSPTWVNTKDFDGYIRHKHNSLYYKVQITVANGSGDSYIKINGVTVDTINGVGTHTDTVDITAQGLTVGEFYTVQVDNDTNNNDAITWAFWEVDTLTLPTLAAFADDDVPTAAEFNELSDYAAELARGLQRPYAVGMKRVTQTPEYPFAGTFTYRGRYLAYRIYLHDPYNDDGGERWTDFRLYVNGTLAMKLRVGDVGAADGAEYFRQWNTGTSGAIWHFFESGTAYLLDLDTYPGGLSFGDTVEVYCQVEPSLHADGQWRSDIHYLYMVPADDAELGAWTAFAEWAHGDYVYGDTTAQNLGILKGNLEALGALVEYQNPAASITIENQHRRYGKRRHRWLHYNTVDLEDDDNDEQPRLEFTYRGETQSVTLPDASARWLALDMDSIDGLWPGTDYVIVDVICAIEDVVP